MIGTATADRLTFNDVTRVVGGPAKMTVRRVTAWYDHALKHVDLEVLVVALVGRSGCGKSTALRSLNQTDESFPGVTTTGNIRIYSGSLLGRDIDPRRLRDRFSRSRSGTELRSDDKA